MGDKLAAYRAFDFEGNEAWKAYRLNLEIPPGKEALLEKKKAAWYQRNIDPDFETSLAAAAKPAAEAPPPAARDEPRPTPAPGSGSAAPRTPPGPTASGTGPQGSWRGLLPGSGNYAQLALLVGHLVVCASAALSLAPFNRHLAYQAYFLCLRTAILTFILKVFTKFGAPRLSPFPAGLQAWIQPVAASTDFFYLMTCMLMMQSPAMWLGVVPVGILAAYHVSAAFNTVAGQHPLWRRYGLRGHQWLAANKESALRACALADVMLGFQAVLAVLRGGLRGAMLAYVYWNQLRLRFWAPDSRAYQLWAWGLVNAKVQPLLVSVPALQRYIAAGQRWFDAPMQQQQQQRR